MKFKDGIRNKVSRTLEVLIPEGKWRQYIDALDRDGKFTRKNQVEMNLILCEQVEIIEKMIEDLYTQLEKSDSQRT